MKIFAIIVTYNGMQWIDRCLTSLRKSTVPIIPIVIDNCSKDETRTHVPANYPEVVWMPQEENLGFGAANNLGMRYALDKGADYVLLLNQDAYLADNALSYMLDISDGDSLVSPVHLNGEGTKLDYMFNYELCLHKRSEIYDDLFSTGKLREKYAIGYVCAACWLLPVSVLRKVGGFDPLFFHYGEDYNYYHRLEFHNVKVLLCPKATVRHDRQIYGHIDVFAKKELRRTLMINVCNVNKSYTKALLGTLRTLVKCYSEDLMAKKYYPGIFLYEFLSICFNSRTIIKHRTENKKGGEKWI